MMGYTLRRVSPRNGGLMMGPQLLGIGRCPYCSIAQPNLEGVWASDGPLVGANGHKNFWAAYECASCASVVVANGLPLDDRFVVPIVHPPPRLAHEDIPTVARRFLQQAFETLHAPDAAAVMAGSAVDAMLKERGYVDGSLYSRIDKALKDNLLTQGMADWAHSVRLGSNRPRHADKDAPHISEAEARQSVEFAEALGNFLFVLTAKIERGIIAASEASAFD